MIVVILLLVAIFGPIVAPYQDQLSGQVSTSDRCAPPSAEHWFGTNEVGQDVFAQVLAGARISLLCGIGVILLGTVLGTLIGQQFNGTLTPNSAGFVVMGLLVLACILIAESGKLFGVSKEYQQGSAAFAE